MSDYTTLTIDAFRKIDNEWCCPLASTMTELSSGIALIFFAASRANMNYLTLIDNVRKQMTGIPPLFVLGASIPNCTPLITDMSLSAQTLPQLFITDITGILRPTSIYMGHRAEQSLLQFLNDQQAASIKKYSSVQRSTLGSSVEQAQSKSAI